MRRDPDPSYRTRGDSTPAAELERRREWARRACPDLPVDFVVNAALTLKAMGRTPTAAACRTRVLARLPHLSDRGAPAEPGGPSTGAAENLRPGAADA